MLKTKRNLPFRMQVMCYNRNVSQSIQRGGSETKRSDTLWSSDTPTFKLVTGAHALTIGHLYFPQWMVLIVEMLFMLFSVYNAV